MAQRYRSTHCICHLVSVGWGGCTTLHDACSEGHIEIVKAILKSKPSREQLNMRDNAEMTALGSAITADREDIFRLLLAAGQPFRVVQ